ncbi:MAG: helix-turn-helix protein [Ramlibacter sp.]|nr:helix-turn-helix protein [Ramlibacter sp.]
MTERWEQDSGAALVAPPAADGVTAGALLRRAREASGLHVAALAVSLKVPVRKLEALEDDRWDVLPDAVFVRALASSVCRSLKIDPQPVLERLPQTSAPRLVHDGDGINTPFHAPSDGAAPTWFDQLTKPVFLAVFALLLGALVLILLPATQQEKESSLTTVNNAETAAPPPVIIPAPAPAATPAPPAMATVPSAGISPAAAAPAPMPSAAAATITTTAAAPPPAAAASSTTAPVAVAAAAPASGIVVFRTKGPSWVEVTDAKGVVAMRKLLEAGEAAGASGALPLQVTIGRVDHTEVQVRGKAFDLRPVSRDNVARFEVK